VPSGKLRRVNLLRTYALLGLIALPLCVAAADEFVRVEVLVFKHANGQSDRWPVHGLEDFSALPDPRQRALLAAWTARQLANPEGARDDAADADHSATDPPESHDDSPTMPARPTVTPLAADALGPTWPALFVHEDRLSAGMQRAFERLQTSPTHDVLSVTTWLQPLSRRGSAPAVRVRDDTPVNVAWLQPVSLPFSISTGLSTPERLPQSIYRLDGSVRIRQRQFRHADLDLVWSERRPQQPLAAGAEEAAFEVHRMRLSRPIQLGRIEYFDSPWLGVLILIEPWQAPLAEASAGP